MNNLPIHDQIEEYLNYCEHIRQMSMMTVNSKRHTYKYFVIGSEIDDIGKLDNAAFNKWIGYQSARGVSARTINTRMAHIMAMLRYFREMGYEMPIKLPLIRKLKELPAKRVFYTREQINKVLEYADEFAWLLIKLSFDTGMRISEVRNLRLDNLFNQRIQFIGKGVRDRESYMSAAAKQRLDEWVTDKNVSDYVWIDRRGRTYSVDELRIRMRQPFSALAKDIEKQIAKKGDPTGELTAFLKRLKDFHPHSLRHSFGSDIQMNSGANLMEIQQMMGHKEAATTQRYLHGLEGQLENIFAKYKHVDEMEAMRA